MNEPLPAAFGVRIFESWHTAEQYRFPRSKKRRIRKKWEKDDTNFRASRTAYHLPNGSIVCHPEMAEKIRREINKG